MAAQILALSDQTIRQNLHQFRQDQTDWFLPRLSNENCNCRHRPISPYACFGRLSLGQSFTFIQDSPYSDNSPVEGLGNIVKWTPETNNDDFTKLSVNLIALRLRKSRSTPAYLWPLINTTTFIHRPMCSVPVPIAI